MDKNAVTSEVISECAIELNRLQVMKGEQLADIIGDCRSRILELFDECHLSVHERQALKMMEILEDDFTDDVLTEHEVALNQLNDRREKMLPILKVCKLFSAFPSVID